MLFCVVIDFLHSPSIGNTSQNNTGNHWITSVSTSDILLLIQIHDILLSLWMMVSGVHKHCSTSDRKKKVKEEGWGLHCLVPTCINSTQYSVGKIPFVIPFVLLANSLISLPKVQHICMCACMYVCVPAPLCALLSFSHLSVKVSIDHYLSPSSIHTNGLHYLLINTDGWRWAIWQLITEAWRERRWERGRGGVAPARCPDNRKVKVVGFW